MLDITRFLIGNKFCAKVQVLKKCPTPILWYFIIKHPRSNIVVACKSWHTYDNITAYYVVKEFKSFRKAKEYTLVMATLLSNYAYVLDTKDRCYYQIYPDNSYKTLNMLVPNPTHYFNKKP